MAIVRPGAGLRTRPAQGAVLAVDLERGPSAAVTRGVDGDALVGRTGHGAGHKVDAETVLGEQPRGVAHRGHLGHHLEAGIAQRLARRPVGIGRVAHDLGLVLFVGQALDEVTDGVTVGHVGRGDGDFVDEFGVRIDGEVGLVAVEATVARLVAVAGLGVDARDDPVLGDTLDDAKDPVIALLGVLAGDEGQQVGGRYRSGGESFSVDDTEGGHGVAHERID